MKQMLKLFGLALILCTASANAADKPTKIRVVNFKSCVEKSKIGKQEQGSFESLKKQMETVLEEKEKNLNELVSKLEDPNYLDSISAEAETELKRKFRALSQEMQAQQQQYMQTLQQANFAIVQKISETLNNATKVVAEKEKYDLVLNDESSFFYNKDLDISDQVVVEMDKLFDKEAKK